MRLVTPITIEQAEAAKLAMARLQTSGLPTIMDCINVAMVMLASAQVEGGMDRGELMSLIRNRLNELETV